MQSIWAELQAEPLPASRQVPAQSAPRLVLTRAINGWPFTSLQQRLVKTGGRLVKHARYYWLLLAEGHLSRRLFASMLRMIAALPVPDG
jgi:hypothetical protein